MRDFQRGKIYKAEKKAFSFFTERLSLEESAKFAQSIYGSAYVLKKYPTRLVCDRRIEVEDGRGRKTACGGYGYIKLPKWSRQRWVIVHETAHTLTPDSHGPQFARCYLDLVYRYLGEIEGDALKTAFAECGVSRIGRTSSQRRQIMIKKEWITLPATSDFNGKLWRGNIKRGEELRRCCNELHPTAASARVCAFNTAAQLNFKAPK